MIIAHVITRFIRGGADENTLLTCNGQAAQGHTVHLIYGDHHPDMVAAADRRVKLHHVPSLVRSVKPLSDARCYLVLYQLFRDLRPDIVHTHESKAGILGRFAAAHARKSMIVHGVHILPFVGAAKAAPIYLALEKLANRITDAFVDVSEGMRDICLQHRIGKPDNHYVVPSGMNLARFTNAVQLDRGAIVPGRRFSNSCTIGLISGALEPRKRVAELVAAIGAAPPASDWALLIAGVGPEQDAVAREIAAHGLQDHVFLLGFCSNLAELIVSADVCLHVAANEGLPRVVVQYVLGGRPVVSTALPGIERVVRDSVNGRLVPISAPEEAASAFSQLAASPETRRVYAEASRMSDLSAWGADKMVAQIENVYAKVAKRKQA